MKNSPTNHMDFFLQYVSPYRNTNDTIENIMSNNKKQLWLFSFLFVYILIAVAGFLIVLFIKNALQTQKQSQNYATRNEKTMPSGRWKTYENAIYKFKLSYPPDDIIKTSSYGFHVISIIIEHSGNSKNITMADFQILLLPKSLAQKVGQNFESYDVLPDNTSKVIKNPFTQISAAEQFTKIHNLTIDGDQAFDYRSVATNANPGVPPEIGTFIEAGNNLILISTAEDNKKQLDQMLSSITFSH